MEVDCNNGLHCQEFFEVSENCVVYLDVNETCFPPCKIDKCVTYILEGANECLMYTCHERPHRAVGWIIGISITISILAALFLFGLAKKLWIKCETHIHHIIFYLLTSCSFSDQSRHQRQANSYDMTTYFSIEDLDSSEHSSIIIQHIQNENYRSTETTIDSDEL